MKKLLLLVAATIACVQGKAGWNTDLSANTQITPTGMNYYDKEMKTNADGYTYISFVTPADSTTLCYRLQIIDPNGNKVLKSGGAVVSAEPYRTYTTWFNYLQTDKNGNAFYAVHDNRFGNGKFLPTFTIYKYSVAGEKLWKGTVLNDSIGSAFGSGLQMMCTDDNGLLCTYCGTDEKLRQDYVLVEKLDADGNKEWKTTVFYGDYLSRPYPYVFDAGSGKALLVWVDGSGMKSNVIDVATGALQNSEPTTVYDMGYASSKVLEVIDSAVGPDNGGMFTIIDSNRQCRLVYVKSDGQPGLGGSADGVMLDKTYDEWGDLNASSMPMPVYDSQQKVFTCFYKAFSYYSNKYQTLYMQQIAADGTLKWDGGKVYLPLQTDYSYGYFRLKSLGDGKTALFYLKQDNSNYAVTGEYVIFGNACDAMTEPQTFAESLATKTNLLVSDLTADSRFLLCWEEKRYNSKYSIFMQDVTPNTSAGITAPGASDVGSVSPEGYYTLSGVKTSAPQSGITLVKLSDGRTFKVAKP